ncbi:MAG: ATP-binding cassette domain-containing protein [Chloroflexi bacterium]|nr:ATP-binding cassette domain-containing protein [Chloroflexota bacterium]
MFEAAVYQRHKAKNEVFIIIFSIDSITDTITKRDLHALLSGNGGQQQMVAIARGLMAQPEMLLLDEPSLGLSPILRQQLAEKIKEIHREGVTLVLVEQNARLGLMLASFGYVLENGELSLKGKTSDLMLDENVRKAYLGM